jgi:hypothetical protein
MDRTLKISVIVFVSDRHAYPTFFEVVGALPSGHNGSFGVLSSILSLAKICSIALMSGLQEEQSRAV